MSAMVPKVTKTQMLRLLMRAGATLGQARRYTANIKYAGGKPAPRKWKTSQIVFLYRRVDAELALDRFKADREAKG